MARGLKFTGSANRKRIRERDLRSGRGAKVFAVLEKITPPAERRIFRIPSPTRADGTKRPHRADGGARYRQKHLVLPEV